MDRLRRIDELLPHNWKPEVAEPTDDSATLTRLELKEIAQIKPDRSNLLKISDTICPLLNNKAIKFATVNAGLKNISVIPGLCALLLTTITSSSVFC